MNIFSKYMRPYLFRYSGESALASEGVTEEQIEDLVSVLKIFCEGDEEIDLEKLKTNVKGCSQAARGL